MRLVYVDDVNEFAPVVKSASLFLARWLNRSVTFTFVTTSKEFIGQLWLKDGEECDAGDIHMELRGARCVPSKAEIEATLAVDDVVYLLDLEFHPIHLKAYGFDLALYLLSRGVSRDRIMIFSAFAEWAFTQFKGAASCGTPAHPPVFHIYEKQSLAGDLEAMGERLAWQVMQMREWETDALGQDLPKTALPEGVVGCSRQLSEVMERCKLIAGSDAVAFITGETGTGKDL